MQTVWRARNEQHKFLEKETGRFVNIHLLNIERTLFLFLRNLTHRITSLLNSVSRFPFLHLIIAINNANIYDISDDHVRSWAHPSHFFSRSVGRSVAFIRPFAWNCWKANAMVNIVYKFSVCVYICSGSKDITTTTTTTKFFTWRCVCEYEFCAVCTQNTISTNIKSKKRFH